MNLNFLKYLTVLLQSNIQKVSNTVGFYMKDSFRLNYFLVFFTDAIIANVFRKGTDVINKTTVIKTKMNITVIIISLKRVRRRNIHVRMEVASW